MWSASSQKVGVEVGKKVISMRRRLRELIAYFGGKVIHPVLGLPGGVSKGLKAEDLPRFKELAKDTLEFALFTLQVFKDIVLQEPRLCQAHHRRTPIPIALTTWAWWTRTTKSISMTASSGSWTPTGKEYAKFPARQYRDFVAEHVEPWSYVKFCYPQTPRLARVRGRTAEQHLRRRPAGAPQRR